MSSRFVSVLLYIYLDSSHNKPGAKQSILGMKSTRPHWHPGSRIRIEFMELLNRSFCVIMYIFIFLVTHTHTALSGLTLLCLYMSWYWLTRSWLSQLQLMLTVLTPVSISLISLLKIGGRGLPEILYSCFCKAHPPFCTWLDDVSNHKNSQFWFHCT